MRVHLLATVRRDELLNAALLVFRTIRVGFPTAEIHVWGNGLLARHASAVGKAVQNVGGIFENLPLTVHDRWIEHIILHETEPVWICDTDVIFWDKVEACTVGDPSTTVLAGRVEPSYVEEWTWAVSVERIHTCLMFPDPPRLRLAMRAIIDSVPRPFGATAEHALIRQHFIPRRGAIPLLYDTMAGLYQAGIGWRFGDQPNAAFDHLHGATYIDLVAPRLTGGQGLAHCHATVYGNLESARGLYEHQKKWYAARSPDRIDIHASPDSIRRQLRGNQQPDADQRQQSAGAAGDVGTGQGVEGRAGTAEG